MREISIDCNKTQDNTIHLRTSKHQSGLLRSLSGKYGKYMNIFIHHGNAAASRDMNSQQHRALSNDGPRTSEERAVCN